MEQFILDVLEKLDIPHLIAIGLIGLFFYSRLKSDIKEIRVDIKNLTEKAHIAETRLSVIETLIHMKECCILKENSNRKVE